MWLWLDDTLAVPELIVGAVASLLAATVAAFVLEAAAPPVRVRLRWLRHAWRLPAHAVADLGRLARVLVLSLVGRRGTGGGFRAFHFEPGSGNDPEDVGRRALAKLAGSFSPNTVVVGIDAERKLILVHQLEPDDSPLSADPLELG
ncbi:MAG TPA: hypothetical protein VGF74_11735 [Thermoleophilaceae bacterium]